jgi:N-acyl-D-aspartate/D-glutamate deacylase
MIGTWVREKEAWSLERAIALMTAEPADFFGIRDRGCLVPGAAADLAIFNFDEVGACSLEPAYDLPRGNDHEGPWHGVCGSEWPRDFSE